MKIPFKWERLCNYPQSTYRAKVLGGWILSIVDSIVSDDGNALTTSLVFIPDPKHKWEV